ncbi:MAG: hypothetical protein COT85_00680 [Chlamydiae bacterium CG10_big_fil_rev_8_21_14_0_10_42_34]|nr:MAG: hypothetical protein COT85_00680 [Chlamydiae bacterium CG10_big_fil_rev_8_21_14_0_10_42_34]
MRLSFAICCLVALSAFANPKKASVKAGKASIIERGSTLEIRVPDRAVLNWESFSIQPHETTRFHQPSKDAAVLNRVTGAEISKLMGKLQADGKVYLINPNGVIIGKDAMINTAGFLASTLDVQIKGFLEGGNLDFLGKTFGKIENLGTIISASGPVVLLAHEVKNQGTIEAPHVSIGAGSQFLVKPTGETEVYIRPDSKSYIDNEGAIKGLVVELQTDGAQALAINHDGVIQANRVVNEGGKVFLRASEGSVFVGSDGLIDVKDGQVHIDAPSVNICGKINAPEDQIFVKGQWLQEPEKKIDGFSAFGFSLFDLNAPLIAAVTFAVGGGDVVVTSGTSCTVQDALVLTGTGNVNLASGSDLLVNATVTANNVNLSLNAGQNLEIANDITSANGTLSLLGGFDVNAETAVSITTTGTGDINLVASNNFPSPLIGIGVINIATGSTLTTSGGNLRIYTINPNLDTYPASINGSVPPGTPTQYTYYPNGTGGVPFQIFTKGVFVPSTLAAEQATATSNTGSLTNQQTAEEATQEDNPSDIETPSGLSTKNAAPCQG